MTMIAAVATTAVYLIWPKAKEYRVDLLVLMLWGLSLCLFIDHSLGYMLDGGSGLDEYFDVSADGVIVGFLMLIPIYAVWELYVLLKKTAAEHSQDLKDESTECV